MRVLVLHSELGVLRGGGENFTRNLFAAFGERGHHVSACFVADLAGGIRYLCQPASTPSLFLDGGRGSLGKQLCHPLGAGYRSDIGSKTSGIEFRKAFVGVRLSGTIDASKGKR